MSGVAAAHTVARAVRWRPQDVFLGVESKSDPLVRITRHPCQSSKTLFFGMLDNIPTDIRDFGLLFSWPRQIHRVDVEDVVFEMSIRVDDLARAGRSRFKFATNPRKRPFGEATNPPAASFF